jgi:hypothetical protein
MLHRLSKQTDPYVSCCGVQATICYFSTPMEYKEETLNNHKKNHRIYIYIYIYPTGSLWRRQSQQSFNVSTPPFLFFSLTHYMFRPLRVIFRWDIQWTISNTTDPLHVRDLIQRCYVLYIGVLTLYSQYMLSVEYKYKSCRHKIV